MAFLTGDFLDYQRNHFLRDIYSIQCLANGTWHNGKIEKKAIDGDSVVIDATFPTLNDIDATITASRIIDIRGKQAGYKTKNVHVVSGQGLFIRDKFSIYEVE